MIPPMPAPMNIPVAAAASDHITKCLFCRTGSDLMAGCLGNFSIAFACSPWQEVRKTEPAVHGGKTLKKKVPTQTRWQEVRHNNAKSNKKQAIGQPCAHPCALRCAVDSELEGHSRKKKKKLIAKTSPPSQNVSFLKPGGPKLIGRRERYCKVALGAHTATSGTRQVTKNNRENVLRVLLTLLLFYGNLVCHEHRTTTPSPSTFKAAEIHRIEQSRHIEAGSPKTRASCTLLASPLAL